MNRSPGLPITNLLGGADKGGNRWDRGENQGRMVPAAWFFARCGFLRKMLDFSLHTSRFQAPMGTLTVNQNKLQKRLAPAAGSDRRLQHDRRRRQGHGLLVRRQGQLQTMLRCADAPLRKVAPIKFDLVAVNMDQKQHRAFRACVQY
ncbi:hypothetical protein FQR65_LT18098 [Abscondita terminalis]|nr:hypothetical protein FQR65_LT18098 [Abscondita terminalis]